MVDSHLFCFPNNRISFLFFLVFDLFYHNFVNVSIFSVIARTQNLGFRLRVSNRRYTFAKTLSDAYASEWFFASMRTIKRENTDVFSLFMAGIAGLEPANAGVKVLCLTDLAISHRNRYYTILLPVMSIFTSRFFSDTVKKDREKVQNASRQNEQVENGVRVFPFLEEIIDQSADRVAYAAGKEQKDRIFVECGDGGVPGEDHTPSHEDIAYGGKFAVCFDIDRVEYDADRGGAPYYTENRPA